MFTITIPGREGFDESSGEFVTRDSIEVQLRHSLASLSKWESIWKKPFLSREEKTEEETLSYIMCMVLSPEISPEVFSNLSQENVDQITEHINGKATATWFSESNEAKSSTETVTAELIYYWMVAYQIPFECENWHLSKLLDLIRVCVHKSKPDKKMPRREMLDQRRALNEARKAKYNTRG